MRIRLLTTTAFALAVAFPALAQQSPTMGQEGQPSETPGMSEGRTGGQTQGQQQQAQQLREAEQTLTQAHQKLQSSAKDPQARQDAQQALQQAQQSLQNISPSPAKDRAQQAVQNAQQALQKNDPTAATKVQDAQQAISQVVGGGGAGTTPGGTQTKGKSDQRSEAQPGMTGGEQSKSGDQARLPSEQIVGMKVRTSQGKDVGQIADLIVNRQTGDIERAVVSYGGFLGIGEKKVAVPWNEVTVDQANNTAQLAMTEEQIKSAPNFEYGEQDNAVIGPGGRGNGSKQQ